MSIFAIPLQVGTPQTFSVTLGGVTYQCSLVYRNDPSAGWVLDIADSAGNPLVQGIPLVTGANLIAQYAYLGFVGGLYVQTISNPDAVPTFDNLGDDGQLFYLSVP